MSSVVSIKKTPLMPDPDISYEADVEEGKTLIAGIEKNQWRLGDLGAGIETKFADATLEKYSADIGVPLSTMKDYVATAKAWPEKVDRSTNWTACMRLNGHPDRHTIAKANPSLTSRQASAEMKAYKNKNGIASDKPRNGGSGGGKDGSDNAPASLKQANEKIALLEDQVEKQAVELTRAYKAVKNPDGEDAPTLETASTGQLIETLTARLAKEKPAKRLIMLFGWVYPLLSRFGITPEEFAKGVMRPGGPEAIKIQLSGDKK